MRRLLAALLLVPSLAWGATPTSLTLDWTLSAPFASIIIERCPGPLPCTFQPLVTVPATAGSYSESGLTPNGTYSYRTRGDTGTFSAGVTGTADATGSFTLTLISPVVDAYAVERNGVVVATPSAPPFIDTGLTPSTSYTYRVQARASNNGTVSAYSVIVTGATLASAPPAPATNLSLVFAQEPPPPSFSATPALVTFAWRVGQPLPAAQIVTISSGSGTWTIQDASGWFDTTGGSFVNGVRTLPATTATFGIQPSPGMNALAAGTYSEVVTVRRGALTATVAVRVTVSP